MDDSDDDISFKDDIEDLDEEAEEAEEDEETEETEETEEDEEESHPPKLKTPITQKISDPLTRIVHIVPDDQRITSNILQLPELVAVLNNRAKSIAETNVYFVDIIDKIYKSPIEIAIDELYSRKCPLKLRRTVGYSKNYIMVEEWDINELVLPMRPSL